MPRQTRVLWRGPELGAAPPEHRDLASAIGPRDLRVEGRLIDSTVVLRAEYGPEFLLNQEKNHLTRELHAEYEETLSKLGARPADGVVLHLVGAMTSAAVVRALHGLL